MDIFNFLTFPGITGIILFAINKIIDVYIHKQNLKSYERMADKISTMEPSNAKAMAELGKSVYEKRGFSLFKRNKET